MRLRHVIPIAALSLIAQGASAQVNLLINGGFESPVVPSPGFSIFLQIPGWTTTSGAGIEIQSGGIAGTPFEGNQLVETDSAGNSGFEQIVPTVAGQAHTFDFVYSPRPGVAAASNTVDIVVNGNVVDTLSADGSALADTSWVRHSYSVVGVGSSTTIEFRATGTSDSLGGFIDDVRFFATSAPPMATAIPASSLPALALCALAIAALGACFSRATRDR